MTTSSLEILKDGRTSADEMFVSVDVIDTPDCGPDLGVSSYKWLKNIFRI